MNCGQADPPNESLLCSVSLAGSEPLVLWRNGCECMEKICLTSVYDEISSHWRSECRNLDFSRLPLMPFGRVEQRFDNRCNATVNDINFGNQNLLLFLGGKEVFIEKIREQHAVPTVLF